MIERGWMMRTALIALALVTLAAPAPAKRYGGEWTDAYANLGGSLKFRGKIDSSAGTVRGKVKCRRCPVKGPFKPTCTGGGSSWTCAGPVGPAANGCTADGFLYLSVFEGTWECGPSKGGVLSFGTR